MAIDKIFDGAVDGIADNLFNSVSNSVSEIKAMQQRKAAENVQLVVQALKKIDADIREKYDGVTETFDKRIASIKDGRDGKDGKNGLDGVNGKDGRDGKDGRNGRDGLTGPRGFDGPKGLDGKDGRDGEDGVSVTDAHIDFDGSLIISLSSGRVINVGEVVAADIAEKIKVITNGGGTSQPVLDKLASLQEQIDLIASALVYKGTWNASTNTPALASSVGTANSFYIVSVAGTTNLNGTSNWGVGDWAVFNGSVWQRVEGGAVGNFTDLTVSGTTTLSNLTASTALALNGSKEVVSVTNTGTGNNVLATSPTLVTPALGTPSSATLTNATGLPLSSGVTGTLPIANGGTGQTTANAAFNALAPSQASNSGKYLTTNGTNTSWATLSGLGTVTSVAATVPSFLSITGSPITSSGTLAIGLSGTALPTTSGGTGLTSFTANGVVYASSTSALATGSALTFDGSKLVNTGYNKSTYQVSTGAVSTFESVGAAYLTYDGETGASVYSRSNASAENTLTFRASTFSFKVAGTQVASLNSSTFSLQNIPILLSGSTSGYTGFAAPATSNFTIYTLPSADGTSGQSLTTNGSGTLSWASGTGGTVTSVSGTGTVSGISLSGTVTSSGNLTLGGALDLSAYSGAGAFTTLSASSTVTLSGGTANGVLYLNASKQATSGSALTFDGTNLGLTSASTNSTGFTIGNTATSGVNWTLYSSGGGPTTAGSFGIYNNSTATNALVLNSSNNLGLGVSPNANWATYNVLQIGEQGVISGFASGAGVLNTGANFYWDGSGYRYLTSNPASLYQQNAGGHNWRIASSGTAGNSISFTQALTLDTSGNLGIGTTSPDTSFDRVVHIQGTNTAISRFTATTYGTSATDGGYVGFNFGGMDVWQYEASYLRFGTNNTERMRIDSSGNVGIGTSSPLGKLDVISSSTSFTSPQVVVGNSSSAVSGQQLWLGYNTSASAGYIQSAHNGTAYTSLVLNPNGGNLGLGVTPSTWRSVDRVMQAGSGVSQFGHFVSGGVGAVYGGGFYRDDSGFKYTLTATPAGRFDFNYTTSGGFTWNIAPTGTAGNAITFTQAMTLDASGNLLVGITSGSYKFMVGDGTRDMCINPNSFLDGIFLGTIQSKPLIFGTNNTERARIDSSGNFMIGTTGAAARFTVQGEDSTASNWGAWVKNSASTDLFRVRNDGYFLTGSAANSPYNFTTGSAANVFIDSNGGLLRSTSSLKYKTDVQDAVHGLAEVMQLRPVIYKGKNDGDTVFGGLIAEEVHAVGLTEFVQYANDKTPDALAYGNMVSLCFKAIQEQQAIIESLKARLDAANL